MPQSRKLNKKPVMSECLSFGIFSEKIDFFVDEFVHGPINSLADIGCGNGMHLIRLASRFPQALLWGFDPDRQRLTNALRNAAKRKVTNIRFVESDLNGVAQSYSGPYDLVISNLVGTFSSRQITFLIGLYALVKPGGTLVFSDFCHPSSIPARWRRVFASFLKDAAEVKVRPATLREMRSTVEKMGGIVLLAEEDRIPFTRRRELNEEAFWKQKETLWRKAFDRHFPSAVFRPEMVFPICNLIVRKPGF